jgi:polysaccharide biosynthesis/export protein
MTRTNLAELAVLMLIAGTNMGSARQKAPADLPSSTAVKADTQTSSLLNGRQGQAIGAPVLQKRGPRYQICKGDIISLDFPFVPAFNQVLTVQPDGYITLHTVGDLHVEGMTVPELVQALRARYGKILKNPVLTIELKDFERPSFVATGEVERPGKYDLRGSMTVTEGIAIAGGFKNTARPSQVVVFRRVSDDWVQVKKVNISRMLAASNLRENLELQPGDILFVPKNRISSIKEYIPRLSVGLYSAGL